MDIGIHTKEQWQQNECCQKDKWWKGKSALRLVSRISIFINLNEKKADVEEKGKKGEKRKKSREERKEEEEEGRKQTNKQINKQTNEKNPL